MKKTSWKCSAAVCSACLLLFTASASAGLITFDTLNPSGENQVPNGYNNLLWDNFYTLNGVTETSSGYQKGVVSRNNVAYNGNGTPASIFVDSGSFKPVMAFMTAAWNDNLMLHVDGYLNGRHVLSRTYKLSAVKPTLIVFGVRVDELDFTTSGGTHHNGYDGGGEHFAMDNLIVTP